MSYKYFILESKQNLRNDKNALYELFYDLLDVINFNYSNNKIIVIFEDNYDIDLKEIPLVIYQDFYLEVRIFLSEDFLNLKLLKQNLKENETILRQIPFKANNYFLTYKDLLFKEIFNPITEAFRKKILRKYYKDNDMKNTLLIYITNNQNITVASEKLFMHRNTLSQKLEKFYNETNLNPKKFKDAVLILKAIE